MGMLTGAAKVSGIMGWPVSHSRSPAIHGHWLARYGIDGAYIPYSVRPEDGYDAIRMLPRLGFSGTNVTLPHKETALRAVDETDSVARRIGAVNTVVAREDGSLHGGNTDAYGFLEHLRASAPDWRPGVAVVLGAGGSARAVAAALVDAGASEVRLANRTAERAERVAGTVGGPIVPVAWEERSAALDGAGLLVNTTSLGMTGGPPLEIALDALPAGAVVDDIVYAPLETPLLAAARRRGLAAVDGLGMLLHQARPGFAAWFGTDPDVDEALRESVLAGL